MKRALLFAAIPLSVLAFLSSLSLPDGAARVASAAAPTPEELPAALARYYPPATPEPVYLGRMLGLGAGISGLVADLLEKDPENARRGFARFQAEYLEVAKLVPEWEQQFPTAPIAALETALASSDTGRCLEAIDALGKACHGCHVTHMVPVQQKFRWRSFADITCEDRGTGGKIEFARLMRDLDLGLSGVAADAMQGQGPEALKYFELFRTRFEQLEQSCLACHAGERKYYVDSSVKSQVEKLGVALRQSPIDAQRVMTLTQELGRKSCGPCHLVHVPAAMAQLRTGH